jgi:type VI secretion system secreted protein VgrG
MAELRFHGGQGLTPGDAIVRLCEHAELCPTRVSLSDFNAENPTVDLQVHADNDNPSGVEWYDYPGEYQLPEDGARRARDLVDSFACASQGVTGDATASALFPGARFLLRDAPGRDDGELAITAVEHRWSHTDPEGRVRFQAIAGDLPYRPPRSTPVPTILNPLTAFVTGPAGEDVHTDEWGRVKLHFPWDRRQPRDDDASDWVPVVQDNTGGSSAIPRVGWEVVVHYLEGDPDRPVALGRVYNGADPFPVKLPELKTHTHLTSLCSPGRDGMNRIAFDDLAGHEQIHISAERDKTVVVGNDLQELVARTASATVGCNDTLTVGVDRSVSVGGEAIANVGGDQTVSIGGGRHVDVGASLRATINGAHREVIGGAHLRRIGSVDSSAAGRIEESVGGVVLEVARLSHHTEARRFGNLAAGGVLLELTGASKQTTVGERRAETVAGLYLSKADNISVAVDDGVRSTKAGSLSASADDAASLVADASITLAAKNADGHGDQAIVVQVGNSKVVLQDGTCTLHAETIRLAIDGRNDLATRVASLK